MSSNSTKSNSALAFAQKFGRSLMLPIASLPVAGLLLRLGQDDVLGKDGLGLYEPACQVISAAGNALFTWLPLLFALGVAIGMARKADGSTALAAVIGYMVFKGVQDAISPVILGVAKEGAKQELINYGVLGGILIGLLAAYLWQNLHRTKLPDWLAFFGGRRFVPIVTAFVALFVAVALALVYPGFKTALTALGTWVAQNAILGGLVFGIVNRLLIPLGLHHLLNSVPWFQLGEYKGKDGKVANGDIFRFLAGDPTAGIFQAGFFPIMMFALPAAALAITHCAKPERRKAIGGLMFGAALTAFVTGVTEPLEFAFLFVAFPLYVFHAVMTGISLAICNAFTIRDGFSFSAGLIDYVINFGIAEKPLMIIVLGLIFAVIYYFGFRFMIVKFNLKTPGREDEVEDVTA